MGFQPVDAPGATAVVNVVNSTARNPAHPIPTRSVSEGLPKPTLHQNELALSRPAATSCSLGRQSQVTLHTQRKPRRGDIDCRTIITRSVSEGFPKPTRQFHFGQNCLIAAERRHRVAWDEQPEAPELARNQSRRAVEYSAQAPHSAPGTVVQITTQAPEGRHRLQRKPSRRPQPQS